MGYLAIPSGGCSSRKFCINLIEYGVSFCILKYKSLSLNTVGLNLKKGRGCLGPGGGGGGRPTSSTPPPLRVRAWLLTPGKRSGSRATPAPPPGSPRPDGHTPRRGPGRL